MTGRTTAAIGITAPDDYEEQDRFLLRRGALSVAYDPLEFWYKDKRVSLSPSEGAILALLMRRGRASWRSMDEALRDGEPIGAVRDVLVYRIRRKFQAVGADDPIETVRGWGLKLRVEQDVDRPACTLIGERKPAFEIAAGVSA